METNYHHFKRWEIGRTEPIVIQPRDLEYLLVLFRNGPTRSNMLHALVRPGVGQNVTSRRLKVLRRAPNRLIDCPDAQKYNYNANSSFLIYTINKNGVDALRRYGCIGEPDALWFASRKIGVHREFRHDLMISDIMCCVQLSLLQQGLTFIPAYEILQHAVTKQSTRKNPLTFDVPLSAYRSKSLRHGHIVPDALFGIRYPDGRARYCALEADRGTETINASSLDDNTYLKKLIGYRYVVQQKLYQSQFGLHQILVLTVTNRHARMKTMMSAAERMTDGKGAPYFLFKSMPSMGDLFTAPEPSPSIFQIPWDRVKHEPLSLL